MALNLAESLASNGHVGTGYDYGQAFSRNLGFILPAEQHRLRKARVAVAGLGGTGSAQVHALARMGIGNFTVADPDVFELVNFNRQAGATMQTLGRRKADVAAEVIQSINPDAEVRTLPEGINAENIDRFLDRVDVVVDSLDFYCFAERFLLYRTARERGLWVVTAAPLGFGFTLLAFDPRGMRFEDYYGFTAGMPEKELLVRLVAGVAPRALFMEYLDRSAISVVDRRLPSVGAAPFLIAGVIGTVVTSLLTSKRPIASVPTVIQYDALLQTFRRRNRRWGAHGPVQALKRSILRKKLIG